jgi:hypothetical protein
VTLEFQNLEVLWICWFGHNLLIPGGFAARQPHLIGFVKCTDPDAFDFLDPAYIICLAYLIPAFAYGRTTELLGPSAIYHTYKNNEN